MYPSSIFPCTIVQLIFTKCQFLLNINSILFIWLFYTVFVLCSEQSPEACLIQMKHPLHLNSQIYLQHFFYILFQFVEFEHCSDTQTNSLSIAVMFKWPFTVVFIEQERKTEKDGNFLVHGCVIRASWNFKHVIKCAKLQYDVKYWRFHYLTVTYYEWLVRLSQVFDSRATNGFILWTHNVTLLV